MTDCLIDCRFSTKNVFKLRKKETKVDQNRELCFRILCFTVEEGFVLRSIPTIDENDSWGQSLGFESKLIQWKTGTLVLWINIWLKFRNTSKTKTFLSTLLFELLSWFRVKSLQWRRFSSADNAFTIIFNVFSNLFWISKFLDQFWINILEYFDSTYV